MLETCTGRATQRAEPERASQSGLGSQTDNVERAGPSFLIQLAGLHLLRAETGQFS